MPKLSLNQISVKSFVTVEEKSVQAKGGATAYCSIIFCTGICHEPSCDGCQEPNCTYLC